MPNRLLHTTSPYLLQHAHQPVDWHPWGKEALQKSFKEDKPLLVSIGYAACHWCHVMAREAFEDPEAAALMNKHFICIKVDREERPDVDQVYVAALQAMGLQAGWPLHVFLLPDQKPFYGGNYFQPEAWKQLLEQVSQAFRDHREQLTASAAQFTQALNEEITELSGEELSESIVIQPHQIFETVYQSLDQENGGLKGAPKFPMPSVGTFLLHYYRATQDEKALKPLNCSLEGMAHGGIYDQLGGGFARYTTDEAWRIPHFEKMLYDNGQLLSLYAQAYTVTQKPLYRKVVQETVNFVTRELMNEAGGFYSALDADSEGIEGKFYTWTQAAIEEVLGEEAPLFIQKFNVTTSGNWEGGANILYQKADSAVEDQIEQARQQLLVARGCRNRPVRDEKVITSWNAMMLQGLADAYNAWGEEKYLTLALRNAQFIEKHLQQDTRLYHSYSRGQWGAPGYLEDYAAVAKAWISLYQATFEEHWLFAAETLTQYALEHFYDKDAGLFHFVEESEAQLIARPKEIFDNVTPSANSVMAHNLWSLGVLLDKQAYANTAAQMLQKISPSFFRHATYLANWATLYMRQLQPAVVVAVVGPACRTWALTLQQHLRGKAWLVGTEEASNLPWLAHKQAIDRQTTIYVCYQGACQAPTHSIAEALAQVARIDQAL